MLSTTEHTAVGAGLLLIMPATVQVSGWSWQLGRSVWWLKSLYWIMETMTQSQGIITHIILCAQFLWYLCFRLKAAVILFATPAVAILIGQDVKSWVKDRVQEPRSFVVWLERARHIPIDESYALKRKDHGHLVREQLAEQQDIPTFLRKH